MATVSEQIETARLQTDFYRDGFGKLLTAIFLVLVAIVFLSLISAYLFISKPEPVVFSVDNDWRVLPPVPVNVPYVKDPDLVQWVSKVLPQVFTYDFINYKDELQKYQPYFTDNGWKTFLNQVDTYANYDTMQSSKMFINANADGAPIILNKALSNDGRYTWQVQMPIKLTYSNPGGSSVKPLILQAYVVRIPTINNLDGVAIDNITVTAGEGSQVNVK